MSSLANLETLDLVNNRLTSLEPLAPLSNLVTVSVDGNELTSLEDFKLADKPRLSVLSARSNKLVSIPEEIGECSLLVSLYLKSNAIEAVAAEISGLKKLKELELDNNPIGKSVGCHHPGIVSWGLGDALRQTCLLETGS